MRFYDVDHGEILLDGQDIRDLNLHDLRRAISLVMQEPIIFNYSIIENLLYGNQKASNTEILESCKVANCLEFISGSEMVHDINDSAQSLHTQMVEHKDKIIQQIGADKYQEELDVLEKLKAFEDAQG